jgi:hypothetical protein
LLVITTEPASAAPLGMTTQNSARQHTFLTLDPSQRKLFRVKKSESRSA